MQIMFGLKERNARGKRYSGHLIRRLVIIIPAVFVLGFVVNQNGFSQDQPPIQVGENNRTVMSGNQTREYLLYIPAKYDGKTHLPLVLLFHGKGGSSKAVMELTGLNKFADEKNFAISAPQGINNSWNVGSGPGGINDVEFVRDLIGEISSKVPIEKKRIFAMGFSLGARFSSRLACELSTDIAAIGAVADLNFPMNCAPSRPISIIGFYGTEDRYESGSEIFASTWAENNGCQKTSKTNKISKNVNQIAYGNCKKNAEVVLYRINGGGHTWPDSPITDRLEKEGIWQPGKTAKDINATNLIWKFFEVHPMP
jgi:polyhydroxybutyrate depolymerase